MGEEFGRDGGEEVVYSLFPFGGAVCLFHLFSVREMFVKKQKQGDGFGGHT